MKKLLFAFIFTTAVATSGFAGNGDNSNNSTNATKVLSGKVTDKQTGEILAGVKIKVNGTNNFCYTDLNGNFLLTVSATEKAEVSAEIVGYKPVTIPSSNLGFNSEISLTER